MITMKYPIVIEKAENNYSAYCPDLPGCVATGKTPDETVEMMREAIEYHLSGLAEDGLPIPESTTTMRYVEVGV